MARKKRDGKRATGIQSKKGYLYIVISEADIKNGIKCVKKIWISTGLVDNTENIKLASEQRSKLLSNKSISYLSSNVSLSDYIDFYLEKKRREVSDTTYAAYFYRAKHIKDFFKDIKVKEINDSLVEKFLDNLFTKFEVQPRTVKDIKVLFGNVMDSAVQAGIISINPVKKVVINKNLAARYLREKNNDDEFFSFEEAQRFLKIVESHELYELFYLTLFFGLRREEVLGIKWSSIDLKQKTMTINHTVTKGTSINRTNATKTESSARVYPLNNDQVHMFEELKKKERKYQAIFGNGYYKSDYIFKHPDGTLYYPDYPTKAFKKILQNYPDLPQGITFHGLRSSCVSILVHKNLDVKSIQKWVGHADIDTTLKIYAKVKDKAAKQEISKSMSDIFQPKQYSNDK